MGLGDFFKKAIVIEGVNHLLNGDTETSHYKYDSGSWRRELDKENDSYRDYYYDEDNF